MLYPELKAAQVTGRILYVPVRTVIKTREAEGRKKPE
jgi:hypothetical protein